MIGPRPILVIGPERSGTSLVTSIIHSWGAYAGNPEHLKEGDVHNPRGYYEYLPIWDFLEYLGVDWWEPGFQDELKRKALVPENRARAHRLIAEMEEAGQPWVWKDPAMSYFLPFWKELLNDPIYVITVRNPLDTARSWEKYILPERARDSISLVSANLLRWQYIMSVIFQNTEDTSSKMFVSFEKLQRTPTSEIRRLLTFLNSECGVNRDLVAEPSGLVQQDLWRNRTDTAFAEAAQASDELKRLYQLATQKIEDPHVPFRRSDYPLPAGWREFVITAETLAKLYRDQMGPTTA